jgi:spore germination cell wall hydrolase CwlJ-like protein
MFMWRNHPKGARFASFGIGLCIFVMMPKETGYQDIAALLARQPGVAERWQKQVFSAASSLQLATYSFSRPIGTSVPQSPMYRLASLDGRDITGAIARNPALQAPQRYQAADFPRVDRSLKGDRLATVSPAPEVTAPDAAPAPVDPATSNSSVFGAKTASLPPAMSPESAAALDPELAEAMSAPPLPQYSTAPQASDTARSLAVQPLEALKRATAVAPSRDPFSVKTSNLFFGSSSLGGNAESIESWQPGAEPLIVMPDPDMKVTASLSPPEDDIAGAESGESVAPKGEVNTDNQHSRSPAERLALDEKSRAKSEKCLAEAVYFESRGEAVRGQIAVAQVVMNRVFSGKYPDTVCGVVYQNKYHHLACQFTFACDNNADVIREPEMWDRAKKIAKAMLDGQIWLPEVGKSTHYHAYWVRPSWVAEMKKMYRTGVHTFYRPRAWGDGSEEPSWGTPAQTAALSAELVQEAKSSAEMGASVTERR